MKAIITIGVSGSGKTTWAEGVCKKDRNWVNINRDDIRFTLTGCSGWKEYKFNKSIESMVTKVQEEMVKLAASKGKNVILSDTNLNENKRNKWIAYLELHKYRVEFHSFEVSYEEAVKRDLGRTNSVGSGVIWEQYKKWHEFSTKGLLKYTPNEMLPEAYVVDVDGTLAQMQGRSPYEWKRVSEDAVRPHVANIVDALYKQGYKIIIMSGRDGNCEEATEDWLNLNKIPFDEFHIREEGDSRKDTVVKQEMFFDEVAEHYNVIGVIDDRPCVTRMWSLMGLSVINVGDPYGRDF